MQSTTNDFFPTTSEAHTPFPSSALDFGNASDPGFMPGSHTLENSSLLWSTTLFTPFNPHISSAPIPYASFYPPPPLPNSSTLFGPSHPPPSSSNSSIQFNSPIPSAPISNTSFCPHLTFSPTNSYTMFKSPLPSSPNPSTFYAPLLPPPPNPSTLFDPPLYLPPSTNSATLPDLSCFPIHVKGIFPKKKSPTRQKSGSAIPNTLNQRKKLLRELKRLEVLQNDEYILALTGTTVTCAGCMKEIKLDSRDGAWFYPGFWHKHKRRCQSVKNMVSHLLLPLKESCALNPVHLRLRKSRKSRKRRRKLEEA